MERFSVDKMPKDLVRVAFFVYKAWGKGAASPEPLTPLGRQGHLAKMYKVSKNFIPEPPVRKIYSNLMMARTFDIVSRDHHTVLS